jgi:hypothetical protein
MKRSAAIAGAPASGNVGVNGEPEQSSSPSREASRAAGAEAGAMPGLDLRLVKLFSTIAFLAAGNGLFLAVPNGGGRYARAVGVRISGFVAAIGFATLAEYTFGWDLGIDQWLIAEPAGMIGAMIPCRIAPLTLGSFEP